MAPSDPGSGDDLDAARPQPDLHRTVVVVDVEGFGDPLRTNVHQRAVRGGLYRALEQAFDTAGVSWTNCDREDRGDGVFILAPPDMPKAPFVAAVPHALAAALHAHNTTHPTEEHIRLRMALHAGEVAYDKHGVTAASINLAFRLVDAEPVRAALAESPGVLAVITSEWFFDEVVWHSPDTDPATFRPVRVKVKETSAVGWISLPDHPYPPDPARLPAGEGNSHQRLGRPRRTAAMLAAAGVTVVAVLGVVVIWQPWRSPGNSPQGQPTPDPALESPGGVMGDPRTADPCALIDPGALSRYGAAELDTDHGKLNRCDTLVRLSDQDNDEVDVWIELAGPEPGAQAVPSSARIERPPLTEGQCRRTLRLSDRSRVVITAKHNDDRPADLCAMADALTDRTAAILASGEIPRRTRPIEPASVFHLNACSLLDTKEVAEVLGGARQPVKGFADWECHWDSSTTGGSALVIFDRSRPLDSRDGQQTTLHGRDTWVDANGHGVRTCVAMIVHRTYTDPDKDDRRAMELVLVVVRGDNPGEQLCQPATTLANAAAARLPR